MRIEQGHAQLAPAFGGQAARQIDDVAMPQVHTVEIAQRNDRAACRFGRGCETVDDLHIK